MASKNHKSMSFLSTELTKPVTCSQAVYPTRTQCEALRSARQMLSECVQCLGQQSQLASEYFVLNRLVYMKHGQLRREKSYQGLKQIRTCLKKFFALEVEKNVNQMHSHFEDGVVQEGVRVYLPSRQMWQHLLSQLLGAAALLTNTASRCAAVFLHVHRHLTAGMLIPANMVFLSLLSRIWACCRGLRLEAQRWYQLLMPVTDILQPTQVAWLREGEALPTDLSSWLRDQGFSCGLTHHTGEGDEDVLESLVSQLQGQGGEDARREPPADPAHPGPVEEDLGDPVDLSHMGTANREEDTSLLQDSQQRLPVQVPGKIGLKEKINQASTLPDLQRILTAFQRKHPQAHASRKAGKCARFLADLQSKARLVDRPGRETQLQGLFVQGRKKVIKFFRTLSSASSPGSVGEARSKRKAKKKTTVVKEADRERRSHAVSASKGGKLPSRKRRKNDPGNNRTKTVQTKRKKKNARKV